MDCPQGFWCMQFKDWLNVAILVATIAAIIVGPIVAVQITLRSEASREKLRRRYQTFYSLMRTRRVTLSPEHVMALNVIQTEFHDDPKVISAYKKYIEDLSLSLPDDAKQDARLRFGADRDDAFIELMYEIGTHLEFKFDRRELAKYSYTPQGWVNIEAEQNAIRTLALELLQGKRPMPVSPFQPNPITGKFPPPPSNNKG
jgi:hypothetical protein